MHKELIISATSPETKLGILENDELVEFLIERRRSEGIVGNIYKGKVTKVLPGMQSAFVDIGLERDAFLYVSDFLEDAEEYDKLVSTAEDEVVASLQEPGGQRGQSRPAPRPVEPAERVERTERVERAEPVEPVEAAAFDESTFAKADVESDDEDEVEAIAEAGDGDGAVEPPEPPAASTSAAAGAQASPLLEGEVRGPRPAFVPEAREDSERREGRRDRSDRGDRGSRDRDRGDRGGGRDRGRDRDRRGKAPRIPSFETRTYEPRPADDSAPTSPLEVIPGESLRKYVARPAEPVSMTEESGDALEANNAPAGNVEVPASAAATEGTEAAVEVRESIASESRADESNGGEAEEEQPEARTRMTDTPDTSFMNRPQQRRGGRRRSGGGGGGGGGDRGDRGGGGDRGGPPTRSDEPRSNGQRSGPLTIAELLREGQEILVQVSKEPLGKKGARITSHIALPGRYLVYMPTVDHVGVSRKIASDEERQRLKRIINEHRVGLPGGFIVRTAAEGRSEADFINDIRFLGNLWADIRSRGEKKPAPELIHSDLSLVQRILRDQLTEEFTAIRIDSEHEFALILDFVNKFQPALVNRVKLHLKDTPIFEEFGLNNEIEKALKPKVWLKSGGYIVINQTEALVAIDINTGKFVGKSNRLEDTITRTNVEAVHEIVRQIRLRNLGGIIVVDFIDMEERKNRQKVMAALEEELKADRVPSKILQFNDFGLVAITRKRTQASLERTLSTPCAHCSGSGWVKSSETLCYEIQAELRKMAPMLEGREITVRVNPEVAKVLKSGAYVSLIEMEEWMKKDIVVKGDPLLHEEHFNIS